VTAVLPWVLAALGLAAAGLALLHSRSQAARIAALVSERDEVALAARDAEKRAEEKAREVRKRGEELGELRKRLDKAKKRANRAQDDQKSEGDRIRRLEEDLRIALADRRAALDELERVQTAGVPKPPPPPPPRPVEPSPDALETLKALGERAERAEGQVAALEAELRVAAREAAKYRKKSRSLEVAYTAQHGELEAKRDRLRGLQEEVERLRALRAVLAAAPLEAAGEEPHGVAEPEVPS